mgnify:FL=1
MNTLAYIDPRLSKRAGTITPSPKLHHRIDEGQPTIISNHVDASFLSRRDVDDFQDRSVSI